MNGLRLKSWLRTFGWRDAGLPLAVYTLAALLITWPLATQFSTHIAGAGFGDSVEYVRLGWWAKYAVQNGLNPFYQGLLGYPDGFFSATQAAQPLIYWPTALFNFFLNPVAAFNLWLLLEVILSGLSAYWLSREVIGGTSEGSMLAALFGGLVFMACPTVQGHLTAGHVNPLSNYALPVLALCLYRIAGGRGSLRTALAGAAALLILALGNFTFPVFTLLPLVLFGGGYLALCRRLTSPLSPLSASREGDWSRADWRVTLRYLAVMFGVGALLIVPFYLPLLADLASPARPAYLQETGWVRYSADLLGFIAPSPFTPWTAAIAPAFSRAVLGTNSFEGAAYLGVVAVGLATIALLKRRRAAGLWLTIALGCMVFSLGPLLKWQDQPVTYTLGEYRSNIVLPWALFQDLPLVSATRTPGRFNVTTGLALGVLAALGLDVVLSRAGRRTLRIAIAGMLAILTLAEYQLFFPFPTTPGTLPAYFESLSRRNDVRAVFDVPWDDPLAQKAALYQQVAHHKPLMTGYVSRLTPVDPAKLTLLSDLAIGGWPGQTLSGTAPSPDENRAILSDNGVDVVVYHWQLLDKPSVLRRATETFGQPVYQDDQIAVFEVPKVARQPETVPLALSSSGWWHAGGSEPFWMTGESSITLYTPTAIDRQWTLTLTPLLRPRRLQLAVDGRLSRAWLIQPPTDQVNLWLRLEPGFHTLRFTLPEGCTPVPVVPSCLLYDTDPSARTAQNCTLPDGQSNVCVGVGLKTILNQDAGPMAQQTRQVQLSGGMTLIGFRAPERAGAGQQLFVETDWHAAQKLPGDFHLFVHLLDQAGKSRAQIDTVPGGSTFPTTDWSASQDWVESVAIQLPSDLPPGTYSLVAGWYSYPDLVRLKVEGDGPGAQDGLVYLRDVEIGP